MDRIKAIPDRIKPGGKTTLVPDIEAVNGWTIVAGSWNSVAGRIDPIPGTNDATWDASNLSTGTYAVSVRAINTKFNYEETLVGHIIVDSLQYGEIAATVRMDRSPVKGESSRQAFWVAIRNRTEAISFDRYKVFVKMVLCNDRIGPKGDLIIPRIQDRRNKLRRLPTLHGPNSYDLLKLVTEAFLLLQSGVVIRAKFFDGASEEQRLEKKNIVLNDIKNQLQGYLRGNKNSILPYLKHIQDYLELNQENLAYCGNALRNRLTRPCMLELIWSYWHEEGMLVQTMNAIAMRFQNRRASVRDPLAQLEIDPLRSLNNLLWGLIQDENNRLTLPRRAYEYDHHYGLSLVGKAVPTLQSADSRSKFIAAFHSLLHRASVFFREDADTTIVADAFPLLNALREVHLILAEGAHNQFGDLPWTARVEMLIMQWLLARPEMREFLRGRHMVPYPEDWMGAVDAMKKLQGWTDTGIIHFHELAVTGERIILSLRYDDWMHVNISQDAAKAWARYWKPEIQHYIHDYHAVTGVDLSAEASDSREAAARYLIPAIHLQRRLAAQTASHRQLPAPRLLSPKPRAEVSYHYGRAEEMSGRLLGMDEID